jgi:DNA-binding response OmpR family regulator
MIPSRVRMPATQVETKPVVLLAEDDEDMRGLLARLLVEAGMDVVQVGDGVALQKYLEQSSKRRGPVAPDIVVSDVNMPGQSGLAALEASRSQVPAVVISSRVDPTLRAAAIRAGVGAIFEKPFKADQLVLAIRRMLGR